jgi:hypothetical protein
VCRRLVRRQAEVGWAARGEAALTLDVRDVLSPRSLRLDRDLDGVELRVAGGSIVRRGRPVTGPSVLPESTSGLALTGP